MQRAYCILTALLLLGLSACAWGVATEAEPDLGVLRSFWMKAGRRHRLRDGVRDRVSLRDRDRDLYLQP